MSVDCIGNIDNKNHAFYFDIVFDKELRLESITYIIRALNYALTFIFETPITNRSVCFKASSMEIYYLYKAPNHFNRIYPQNNITNLIAQNFSKSTKYYLDSC